MTDEGKDVMAQRSKTRRASFRMYVLFWAPQVSPTLNLWKYILMQSAGLSQGVLKFESPMVHQKPQIRTLYIARNVFAVDVRNPPNP